jgi:hypothetical protein
MSGGGTAPSISAEKVGWWVMSNIARQVNISWDFAGTGPITGSFSWNIAGGASQPDPSFSNGLILLNALLAGTTYDFTIGEVNSYGHASYDGDFSTGNAPTNEFVGWVSQLVSKPSELNQVGSPLTNGAVSVTAYCEVEYADTWVGSEFYPLTTVEQIAFIPGVSIGSSGYYTLGFPQQTSYSVTATGDFNIQVTVTETLSSSGTCTTTDSEGAADYWADGHTASSNNYLLTADANGNWNASDWISSSLSASNDYRQFGLPPNTYSPSTIENAFVHTSNAACNVTALSGGSQIVYQSIGGTGFTDDKGYGSFSEAIGPPDENANVWQNYYTTGLVNETDGFVAIVNTWAVGAPFGGGTNNEIFSDPLGSTAPAGATPWWVGPGGDIQGWESGGSYTSTSGLDMLVGVSVGWDGASIGADLPLTYQTSVVTSSVNELTCHFDGPPAGSNEYFEYDYDLDGSQSANSLAVNVHIWYVGECSQGAPGCD